MRIAGHSGINHDESSASVMPGVGPVFLAGDFTGPVIGPFTGGLAADPSSSAKVIPGVAVTGFETGGLRSGAGPSFSAQ